MIRILDADLRRLDLRTRMPFRYGIATMTETPHVFLRVVAEEGGRTVITRKTTIVSRLSPVWYWSRMEKIGVETEHEYLFEEIKRKINRAKQ